MQRFGMLKQLLFVTVLLGIRNFAFSQIQLPDSDFENWTAGPSGQYEEPSSGWWTSLNALKSLNAPVTVEKTADAHTGNFAAKVTSKQWGTILLPGLLVSGEFDIQNPQFLVQGKPFADLPQSFQGWYKYTSVNGDSAGIGTLLTRWNVNTARRDTVAAAGIVVRGTQSSWTAFDIPYAYFLSGLPDSITVALVSSGDGANFNGQVGSTLWVDDLQLGYATAAPDAVMAAQSPRMHMVGHALVLDLPAGMGPQEMRLLDLQGRVRHAQMVHVGQQEIALDVAAGIYLVELYSVKTGPFRQKIWVAE